jgi:hypothetical protein
MANRSWPLRWLFPGMVLKGEVSDPGEDIGDDEPAFRHAGDYPLR